MCQKAISTPLYLYRHLIRRVKSLPSGVQDHYKHYIRQGFNSHADEKDPERIQQIIDRALQDAEWIIKKYSQKTS